MVPTVKLPVCVLLIDRSITGATLIDNTTVVGLYVTVHARPGDRAGKLVVANVPLTGAPFRIVNRLPAEGAKPLIKVTFRVPARLAAPVMFI